MDASFALQKEKNKLIDWRGHKKNKNQKENHSFFVGYASNPGKPTLQISWLLPRGKESIPVPIKTIFIGTNKVFPYK
jgi:hypothetical protein